MTGSPETGRHGRARSTRASCITRSGSCGDTPGSAGATATNRHETPPGAARVTRIGPTLCVHQPCDSGDGHAQPRYPLRTRASCRSPCNQGVGRGTRAGAKSARDHLHRALAVLHHAWISFLERRRARRMRAEMQSLDHRTLRDLGLYREEIDSVNAEYIGQAALTRIRVRARRPCAAFVNDAPAAGTLAVGAGSRPAC